MKEEKYEDYFHVLLDFSLFDVIRVYLTLVLKGGLILSFWINVPTPMNYEGREERQRRESTMSESEVLTFF